jgi:hypothetical protein
MTVGTVLVIDYAFDYLADVIIITHSCDQPGDLFEGEMVGHEQNSNAKLQHKSVNN